MNYEKRSELRKECSKFLRFAYLADFIAMESLSNIFVYSVKELQEKLEKLMAEDESNDYIVRDLAQKGYSPGAEPLFQVFVQPQLQLDLIDEQNDINFESIGEFIPPPFGESKPEDFNIIYHVRLKKPKEPKPEEVKTKKKGKEEIIDEDDDEEDQNYNEEITY